MKSALSRRRFLGGAGALVGLPLLASALPRELSAAPLPKRFVAFYVPNGMHMPAWTPTATGRDFALPALLSPLEPVRSKLLVLSGLANMPSRPDGPGDHAAGTAGFLTARHIKKTDGGDIKNGISVDQLAARALARSVKISSLQLGIEGGAGVGNCDSGYSCAYVRNISWASETQPLPKTTSPEAAFDQIFDGYDPRASAAERERRRRRRASVLDYVNGEAKVLHGKLGKSDREKLDEYTTGVRELERRIQSSASACALPEKPPPTLPYPEHVRQMIDLMVLALQCDATRVVSFMLGNGGSTRSYEFLGVSGGHHDISHHQKKPENLDKLVKIGKWEVEQLAYLLTRMDAVHEGDTSLLDSSAVFFSSEIEDGDTHAHSNLPIVIGGSLSGALPSGQHLKVRPYTPVSSLFVTLLGALGTATDSFGDDGHKPLDLGGGLPETLLGRPLQRPPT